MHRIQTLRDDLQRAGIRCDTDTRSYVRPGAKYYEWERKGVPLRIVIGTHDIKNGSVSVVNRVTGEKSALAYEPSTGDLSAQIHSILTLTQHVLFQRADERLKSRIFEIDSYERMKEMILLGEEQQKGGAGGGESPQAAGFYLVPWKNNAHNEERIKEECKATIRCYPASYNQEAPRGRLCFYSGEEATHMALFAKAF
jgi:prolyl-tRNA synthetase